MGELITEQGCLSQGQKGRHCAVVWRGCVRQACFVRGGVLGHLCKIIPYDVPGITTIHAIIGTLHMKHRRPRQPEWRKGRHGSWPSMMRLLWEQCNCVSHEAPTANQLHSRRKITVNGVTVSRIRGWHHVTCNCWWLKVVVWFSYTFAVAGMPLEVVAA